MTFLRMLCRVFLLLSFSVAARAQGGLLPSWNDGAAILAPTAFVQAARHPSRPAFVPPDAPVAAFGHDGTLRPSHPISSELAVALDRVKELAPQHPEWKATQPFKAMPENHLGACGSSSGDTAGLMIRAFHDDARRGSADGPAHGLPNTPFDPFSQIRDGRSASEKLARRKHEWRLASHRSLS